MQQFYVALHNDLREKDVTPGHSDGILWLIEDRTMTTHDNTKAKLKAFDAFAPVADALGAIPNLELPGVARDFASA